MTCRPTFQLKIDWFIADTRITQEGRIYMLSWRLFYAQLGRITDIYILYNVNKVTCLTFVIPSLSLFRVGQLLRYRCRQTHCQ